MIASAGPTPLWYAARSTGYVSLLLLTAIILLGVTTSVRWGNRDWPRFLTQALHRNLSLLVLVFLAIHIVTSVVDPFAGIAALNAVAPFTGSYRPIWLGLGVVAVELMVALVVTSLLRRRISFAVWRWVHWAAYLSWPAAILHTLGTGSDVRSVWAVIITLACVGAVFAAVCWRVLGRAGRIAMPLRALWIIVSTAATAAVLGFALAGPLQNGWARSAGTPQQLLTGASTATSSATRAPVALALNLNDTLSGTVAQAGTGVRATLVSVRDAGLRVTITVDRSGRSGALVITQSGTTVCSTTAVVGSTVTATCNGTAVIITVAQQSDGSLTGQLQTRGGGQ